jgi:hypothetical protein
MLVVVMVIVVEVEAIVLLLGGVIIHQRVVVGRQRRLPVAVVAVARAVARAFIYNIAQQIGLADAVVHHPDAGHVTG